VHENEHFASDVKGWFYDNTDSLYKNYHMPNWLKFLISLLFTVLFAWLGYKIVESHYRDPQYEENLEKLK